MATNNTLPRKYNGSAWCLRINFSLRTPSGTKLVSKLARSISGQPKLRHKVLAIASALMFLSSTK